MNFGIRNIESLITFPGLSSVKLISTISSRLANHTFWKKCCDTKSQEGVLLTNK